MSKKILLIGGGGHCKSVLDSLIQKNEYSKIGIIDKIENVGRTILGVPVIGCDNDLVNLYNEGYRYAFITVGSIGNPKLRIQLFNRVEDIGFLMPNIIDPTAIVSKYVSLESGIFVGKGAIINVGSRVGKGVIINTQSIIEHDCEIGKFAHIAPGTALCGEAQIGANTHIGAKSVIKQQTIVGANTVVGMGSVVLKDIADNMVAYGNPCKEVKPL